MADMCECAGCAITVEGPGGVDEEPERQITETGRKPSRDRGRNSGGGGNEGGQMKPTGTANPS